MDQQRQERVLARIRSVLEAEAKAIRDIQIDRSAFLHAIRLMRDCQGKIIVTGIGKAGHVARKFAATLCSNATPAVFMHPAEAAHGDLGLVAENDLIIALSTSGKSREVVEMVALAKHLGVSHAIGITSHPDSPLRDLSDIVLDMGEIQEPCPLGLTPSASIAAMLAISDALALALMDLKGVTRDEYGLRHHGGYLGHKSRVDNLPPARR